ncbi:hypothetical protein ACHHYP_05502 [Achlya hypogyna]|uniref:RING-type domain-containing protein n=1 Tax=Achlya hypogyna TaxID=1202772 RepID=A0A1V9YXJ2_ACHHY|nr:hypothetical protein ACHHYP_05502 [Achlya hypogyna]
MGASESRPMTAPPHASGSMLWKAAKAGDLHKVRAILLHADAARFIEYVDANHGTTPLMMAALAGKAKIVMLLLDKGANANARTPLGGNSALHLAATKNKVAVVEALLRRCDAHALNRDGLAPLDLARLGHHREATRAFERQLVTAKGSLYVKKGHSVFTTWKKQWCMLFATGGAGGDAELALYPHPDAVMPSKVLFLTATERAVSPSNGTSRHNRKHTFHFTPNVTLQRYERDTFTRSEEVRRSRHLPHYSAAGVRFATETEEGRTQWIELLGPLAFTPTTQADQPTLEPSPLHGDVRPALAADLSPSAPPLDEEDTRRFDSNNDCVVCMDMPRAAVCVPCGHLAGCFACLTSLQAKGCPICRAPIATVVRVFTC